MVYGCYPSTAHCSLLTVFPRYPAKVRHSLFGLLTSVASTGGQWACRTAQQPLSAHHLFLLPSVTSTGGILSLSKYSVTVLRSSVFRLLSLCFASRDRRLLTSALGHFDRWYTELVEVLSDRASVFGLRSSLVMLRIPRQASSDFCPRSLRQVVYWACRSTQWPCFRLRSSVFSRYASHPETGVFRLSSYLIIVTEPLYKNTFPSTFMRMM